MYCHGAGGEERGAKSQKRKGERQKGEREERGAGSCKTNPINFLRVLCVFVTNIVQTFCSLY